MRPSDKIIHLRQVLADRFPQQTFPHPLFLPTGCALLDQTQRLRKGCITQLIAPEISAGSTLLLQQLIRAMPHGPVALIDGHNNFEPAHALPHLLWIRCGNTAQALQATDLLLRDGNLYLVILDLKQSHPTELRKIPGTTWYRLQRVAKEAQSTLFLITRYALTHSAATTVTLEHHFQIADLSRPAAALLSSFNLKHQHREPFYAQA